ncbi:MAG: lysophospholipid acyltransferase family protein [Gammaproteobacteria bacterium]
MMFALRLSYRTLLLLPLFCGGFMLAALLFPLLKKTRPPVAARHARNVLKKLWIKCFAAIVNLKIEQHGKPALQPALFIGNHISWLDILAVGQTVPGHFVAKSDIMSWPVIGYLSAKAEAIFIRRGDKNHIRTVSEQMAWLLQQNCNLFVFPEGTTTRGDRLLPFHSSLLQPALLTRTPVLPFSLQYLGDARFHAPYVDDHAFFPHLLKILALPHITVKLTFHPPIDPHGKTRNLICQAAMQTIAGDISGRTAAEFEAQAC